MKRLTALVITLVLLTACSTSKPLYNSYSTVNVENKSLNIMRSAIVEALGFKRWEILDEEPGKFRAGINVRSHYAEILVSYDATKFEIVYLNSQNLDYRSSKQTIHRNYNRWIHYLEQEIKSRVQTINYSN